MEAAIPGTRRDRASELIANMADSYNILLAYHANNPDIGMALTKNLDYYKMFLLDTGLFVTLIYKDRAFTDNEIYRRLLSDKQHTDLGYVYENMVAQMTVAKGDALFYYTFPSETSNHHYEIDFLLTRKNKLCPIEVKSSGYKTHASLDAFQKKYANRIGIRRPGLGIVSFPAAFETAGLAALAGAEDCDLLLMDEIGRMERRAEGYSARILTLLDGGVPILLRDGGTASSQLYQTS